MARTFTLPKKGSGNWTEGWHTLTISDAKYGEWNGSKYIDIWFDGYPENFNMRMYAKIGKDGEEFAIGNLYRFANAGITDALESAEGETVLKIDDSEEALKGKTINAMFYKDGKFTRVLQQVAPTEFTNIVDKFDEKDVKYFKGKAESYFSKWVEPKLKDEPHEETTTETSDIPF
tara:strand:- start:3830 stop:4354 length:525 start_codon:yes stop_codon:yes gene_type:complete